GGLPGRTGRRPGAAAALRPGAVQRPRRRSRGRHRRGRGCGPVLPDPRRLMAVLEGAGVLLRPLRLRDRAAWQQLRAQNADWLRPWEATSPLPGRAPGFAEFVAASRRLARRGE